MHFLKGPQVCKEKIQDKNFRKKRTENKQNELFNYSYFNFFYI